MISNSLYFAIKAASTSNTISNIHTDSFPPILCRLSVWNLVAIVAAAPSPYHDPVFGPPCHCDWQNEMWYCCCRVKPPVVALSACLPVRFFALQIDNRVWRYLDLFWECFWVNACEVSAMYREIFALLLMSWKRCATATLSRFSAIQAMRSFITYSVPSPFL